MTRDGAKVQYGGVSGNPSTPTKAYWVNVFDATNWERYFYAIPICPQVLHR